MDRMVSTDDVAGLLGVSRPTVIKYIQESRLRAVRTGKAYKIGKNELLSFARGNGMEAGQLTLLEAAFEEATHRKAQKKTGRLDLPDHLADMACHDPALPLSRDKGSNLLYYLAVRSAPAIPELIIPVLNQKFFIGRHGLASLVIQDPFVSNIHVALMYQAEFVKILDQSTNGTYVGRELLATGRDRVVGDGDPFRIGTTSFTLIAPNRIDLYLSSGTDAASFHERAPI